MATWCGPSARKFSKQQVAGPNLVGDDLLPDRLLLLRGSRQNDLPTRTGTRQAVFCAAQGFALRAHHAVVLDLNRTPRLWIQIRTRAAKSAVRGAHVRATRSGVHPPRDLSPSSHLRGVGSRLPGSCDAEGVDPPTVVAACAAEARRRRRRTPAGRARSCRTVPHPGVDRAHVEACVPAGWRARSTRSPPRLPPTPAPRAVGRDERGGGSAPRFGPHQSAGGTGHHTPYLARGRCTPGGDGEHGVAESDWPRRVQRCVRRRRAQRHPASNSVPGCCAARTYRFDQRRSNGVV